MSSNVKCDGRLISVAGTATIVVYFAICSFGSISPVRAATLLPPPKPGQLVWLTNYLEEVHVRDGFYYTLEDIVPQGKAPYKGLANLRLPMPAGQLTLRQMVRSLRTRFPELRVWRDHVNRRIVHIAMAAAEAWKHNPLVQKLTFRGTMSIEGVESRIIQKLIPKAHFYYCPGGQHTIPYFPDIKPLKAKRRFNIGNMSLRQFLTTGVAYREERSNRLLWSASLLQAPDGKFTGRVNIVISAVPITTPVKASPGSGAGSAEK